MRRKKAVAGSQAQDTSGLSCQCSATDPQQPDNHQPLFLPHNILNSFISSMREDALSIWSGKTTQHEFFLMRKISSQPLVEF